VPSRRRKPCLGNKKPSQYWASPHVFKEFGGVLSQSGREPFFGCFWSRPRGRNNDSRPSRAATSNCHASEPNGWPRCMLLSTVSSFVPNGRFTGRSSRADVQSATGSGPGAPSHPRRGATRGSPISNPALARPSWHARRSFNVAAHGQEMLVRLQLAAARTGRRRPTRCEHWPGHRGTREGGCPPEPAPTVGPLIHDVGQWTKTLIAISTSAWVLRAQNGV
jgi:hypothetical protein